MLRRIIVTAKEQFSVSRKSTPCVYLRNMSLATSPKLTNLSSATDETKTQGYPSSSETLEGEPELKKQRSNGPKHNYIYKPIVWIDCEMTGLDVFNDNIIEICCILTDGNLNVVHSKGYESIIHCPEEKLKNMNEWCINTHTNSGLYAKVLNSKKTLEQVESELYEYIESYIPKGQGILAGNSVHMDKFFMMREMPKVIDHLTYRLLDVSSIMEFGHRHNPKLMKLCPKKKNEHTARADILESIEQLKWYRNHYLKSYEESEEFIKSSKSSNEKLVI